MIGDKPRSIDLVFITFYKLTTMITRPVYTGDFSEIFSRDNVFSSVLVDHDIITRACTVHCEFAAIRAEANILQRYLGVGWLALRQRIQLQRIAHGSEFC